MASRSRYRGRDPLNRLDGDGPMTHTIEPASSGRSKCRGCGEPTDQEFNEVSSAPQATNCPALGIAMEAAQYAGKVKIMNADPFVCSK